MKRYSHKVGMMVENPQGGWVKFEDVDKDSSEGKVCIVMGCDSIKDKESRIYCKKHNDDLY